MVFFCSRLFHLTHFFWKKEFSMRSRWFLAPGGAVVFLLVLVSTALPGYAAGRHTRTSAIPRTDVTSIVVDVLQNMQTNGFDAQANSGQGSLWLNWRYGTDPL